MHFLFPDYCWQGLNCPAGQGNPPTSDVSIFPPLALVLRRFSAPLTTSGQFIILQLRTRLVFTFSTRLLSRLRSPSSHSHLCLVGATSVAVPTCACRVDSRKMQFSLALTLLVGLALAENTVAASKRLRMTLVRHTAFSRKLVIMCSFATIFLPMAEV